MGIREEDKTIMGILETRGLETAIKAERFIEGLGGKFSQYVLQYESDARLVKLNYGTGHAPVYSIMLDAFAPAIGTGSTEIEAWKNAALDIWLLQQDREAKS